MTTGLRIPRRYTTEGADPYSTIEWARRDSRITNPDGSVVFEVLDAEVPASWSQVATDIVVSKYFRKAGVPQTDADGKPVLDDDGNPVLGSETSSRQVFNRLATTWRYWGEKHGYFASAEDAQAYEDEMKYMLANQIASPNSPQWFNTGLAHAYGITGTPQGFWYVAPDTGEMTESPDSYTHPAPHACFPAGARITTREGFKFIEKIEPGDAVLTHKGRYRTVVKTMQRQIDEDLVTLSISRLKGEHFSATANHPVLAVRRWDAKAGSRNPEWIPAGALSVGDFVIVARPPSSASIPLPFDLATYAGPNFEITDRHLITRNSGHRPTMSRFVDFNDPSLLRLLGYWLGDGSIGHESRDGELSSVNFVFRGSDLPSQQDVLALMGRHFGVQAPVELAKGQNTAHLRFIRRPLARFFADTFGFGFAGKALPGFVHNLPRSHRLELLVGLFKSDGCTLTVKNSRLMCFDQSNQNLAEGVWRLLRSLGYAPSITGGKVRPGGTVPHFRVTVSVKDATDLAALCGVEVPESPMHDRFLRVGDDVGYRIQGIDRVPSYGTVFNFEVEEDESYVANNVVVHNCFINGVNDDLVNPGGIMDLWVREARLFKMGSGTGSNFSQIRAENETLSGGGKSSGVMGFLRIGDRAAGAIKSGGTTRRAAKMVILDLDHPDVEEFIDWKMHEEEKARILINHGGYAADFNGEAYATVSGQNSNNSVRVPNEFIEAVRNDDDWQLRERTSGRVRKTIKARDLWRKVAEAAWACADPGVQFDTIINEWHTSPAGGKIRATNPCAEYVFLDNTACNLASINLVKFFDDDSNVFDSEGYEHAIRLWTITLEISVTMAHFPSREIAQGSYDYRTLGLGYANLGTLLMRMGLPYDSDAGRAVSGAITSILTGYSYATSAELSGAVGPFPRFAENREAMLRVIRNHRRAAYNTHQSDYEGLSHFVMGINPDLTPSNLLTAARQSWDLALDMGERHGFRNAQVTVIAPTGCLVGGSLVPTERGLVRLGTLGDPRGSQWQDLGIKVGTDEGARTASQFYVNGVEPVVTVDTARGYRIQGTPTHRVKVVQADGSWVWKRFAEIAKDDLVPLQMNQLVGEPQTVNLPPLGDAHWTADFATTVPRTMTPELAEFVGYFMGDGSLHARGIRLCVTAGDFDVVERLSVLGKQLFNLEAHVSNQTGYVELAFHSVPLVMWWEACGFVKRPPVEGHTGKGWHPHIPDAVLASNDRLVHGAFVRGLFEADGYVHGQGYPSWTTTSLEFSRDVQSLLLALGYPMARKFDTTGWGQSVSAALRTANTSYNRRFAEEIGFISGRKQSLIMARESRQASHRDFVPVSRVLLDRLAPTNDDLRKTMLLSLSRNSMISRRSAEELLRRTEDNELRHLLSYFYDRVASADLGEEQMTFDLSVPENVTYVANGFVSHNTIGLQMDCDTTGVEPDFSLVKFKKLAGGGYFKIVNQSVTPALENLGYSDEQIGDIIRYIVGTSSLVGAPYINRESLMAKGFTEEDMARIEATLPAVFELRHAFNPFVLGEATMQRLGFEVDEYATFEFDLLRALGFTGREIWEATEWVCGQQTIEGAPHLKDEHLAVFDTANRNGRNGERLIHHTGHIRMLAATQPFLSGAASKTINMPNEATIEDIEESYMLSFELGVKCMALYRDGSKASQPLSSSSDDSQAEDEPEEVTRAHEIDKQILWGKIPVGMSPTQAYAQGMHPPRFLLPPRRGGYTQEAKIGGHKVYLRTGEYEDGTLGEVFIDLAKEGATLRGILSCFAIAVSKGLQFGVPLEEFVDTFTFQTFEPRGLVEGHPNIKMANSIVDYVFRALAVEYLKRDDLAQVPPTRDGELPEPASGLAVEAGIQLDLTDAVAEQHVAAVASAVKFLESRPVAPMEKRDPAMGMTAAKSKDAGTMAMQSALGEMMGDAPLCDTCGHITIRNGSCYKCLNCGNSLGCS